jgi:hypothetical protein
VSDADDADAADASSARTRKSLYGPPSPNAGSIGLQGQVPASRGAVMAAPRLRLGAGERPGRDLRAGASGWHCGARSGSAACMRPGRAGEPQSAEEAGCRRLMPHSAADHLERRKGQSRSVHVGRHTSRLKPRTSSGRVIDSSPFSLVRGDANQRRETPENSTRITTSVQLSMRPKKHVERTTMAAPSRSP